MATTNNTSWPLFDASQFSNQFTFNFFPRKVSAYFRTPHAAKVIKSSSRNQSPRTSARRRMTTPIPARTRSVVDSHRNTASSRSVHAESWLSRPISWHPNFVNNYDTYQSFNSDLLQQSSTLIPNTNFSYGLITPNTSVVADEYQLDCPDVPLDQMTGQDYTCLQQQQCFNMPANGAEYSAFSSYTPLSATPLELTDYDVNNMMWPSLPPSMPQYATTAPTSPDFLPMPDLGQPFTAEQPDENDDGPELVGMGLYDSPAQIQSSSLLFGESLPVRRKSLKLEEAFEPGPQLDSDEADAESGDDDSTSFPEPIQNLSLQEDANIYPSAMSTEVVRQAGYGSLTARGSATTNFFPYAAATIDQNLQFWT